MIIVIGTVYGGFNEIWQGFVASRFASMYDVYANGIGMTVGSIVSVKYLVFAND